MIQVFAKNKSENSIQLRIFDNNGSLIKEVVIMPDEQVNYKINKI